MNLRADDGTAWIAGGPLTAELARLTGHPIRIWGVPSALGISVYGYRLRGEPGVDRATGILLERPDGWWLLGEEAIRLADPPAELTALDGAHLWVTGERTADGLRPTLFGQIREGA